MKKYLITHVLHGVQYAYYSETFNEADISLDATMVVYDLENHKMLVNSLGWSNIR